MQIADRVLSVLVPPRCAVCAAPCERREAICRGCADRLDQLPVPPAITLPELDSVWASAPYQGVARELVAALKFRQLLSVGEEMARRIAKLAPDYALEGMAVAVPAAPLRSLMRGFDPADLLARIVYPSCRAGFAPFLLDREDGGRQVGRQRRRRLADPPRIKARSAAPERVLLVDDVTTTGATLIACAEALREAGAEQVRAVTFARTL